MADEVQENVVVDNAISTALQNAVFGNNDSQTQTNNIAAEVAPQAPTETPTEEQDVEEILDPSDYLKRRWGWDSEETAENEIKTLREKADKVFEYKNDDSRKLAEYINEGKIDDLYQFLDTQKRVSKLSSADVADKNIATELVKFGLQKDNPNLSSDDIDFLFNERYSLPDKPIETDYVDEDTYKRDLEKWQSTVSNIEKKLVIEAKMQQPKMAQLKSELVLPQIQREIQQTQPSQKDLDDFKQLQQSFNQSVEKTINDFNGFSVQVKDKDVDYTVSYAPSKEERDLVNDKIKSFSESGFNANALFAERWLGKEPNTLNVAQITEDMLRLFGSNKIDNKLATDAANKRLEDYLKSKKQINVNETTPTGNLNLQKSNAETISDRLREAIFG